MKDTPIYNNYVMCETYCGDNGTYGYTRFEQKMKLGEKTNVKD